MIIIFQRKQNTNKIFKLPSTFYGSYAGHKMLSRAHQILFLLPRDMEGKIEFKSDIFKHTKCFYSMIGQ